MITAKKAKKRALKVDKVALELDKIELDINHVIENGNRQIDWAPYFVWSDKSLVKKTIKALKKHKYKVRKAPGVLTRYKVSW